MSRLGRALTFRRTLPIAQLLLSVALLWTVRQELTHQVRDAIRFGQVSQKPPPTPEEAYVIVIPERLTQDEKAQVNKFESRKWLPSVLNLPALFIQLPYVIFSPSKEEWVPVGLDLMTWRAVTWPLIGLLFWWSAGRGIDALLAIRKRSVQPRITVIEAVIGLLCLALCAITVICGGSERDSDFPRTLFSFGFAMWAVLAGTVVLARLLQWRVAKHSYIQA